MQDYVKLKNGKLLRLEDITHVAVSLIDNDCRKKGETIPIVSSLIRSRFKYVNKNLEIVDGDKKTIKVITRKSENSSMSIWHYKKLEFDKLKRIQESQEVENGKEESKK